jgi:CubicO group peptidase (beta-lactamase class C family)
MKLKPTAVLPLLVLICACKNGVPTQVLPDSTTTKINKVFSKWDNTASPGCAVGIVRNDSLVFAKGYGMANLEYGLPITPTTIFHMASISKQFTAYSIVLLAKQGKLNLDDDIHKYLPWFPDLKEKITIRNLLNHTSGVRDQWQLLAIAGTRLEDVITQDQIIKILGNQQALNFNPGEQYMYSNSGFTMLAEIVKSVSGQTLRQFTDSAIFKPLGMVDTHVHDDYTEIVKNRSYSYDRKDSTHFANSILSYSVSGATSLFTNINDMSKWVMNFYKPVAGNGKDIEQLTQNGKLNSGKELTYALGIVSGKYNGWKEFSHGGADAGYRTYISVFPDAKMGFIVFSNLGDVNTGGLAHDIADLFIKDTAKKTTVVKNDKVDSSAAILKDTVAVKIFLGDYISDDGLPLNLELKRAKLYYHINGETNVLVKQTNDSFYIISTPPIKFAFSISAKDTLAVIITPDQVYQLKKYKEDTAQADGVLQEYAGTYYCPELDCKYGIKLKEHHMYLTNAKYNDTKLTLAGPEHLLSDFWWMDHLFITRNPANKITGFEVNSGRVMHLRFNKME